MLGFFQPNPWIALALVLDGLLCIYKQYLWAYFTKVLFFSGLYF